MNAYPVEKVLMCSVLFVSLPGVILVMNCGTHIGQEEIMLL